MKIKPLSDRVVVKPEAVEEKTASGIILPDTAKEKPQEGTVVAGGSGKISDSGNAIKNQPWLSKKFSITITPSVKSFINLRKRHKKMIGIEFNSTSGDFGIGMMINKVAAQSPGEKIIFPMFSPADKHIGSFFKLRNHFNKIIRVVL